MNITKENVDDLNALLKVKVEKSDYQENVDKALTNYRKNANIPGFRKGKVPMGIIKKQYGKNVLGDELNRIVSEGLFKYVDEQEFEILGNPLPKNDIEVKGDFDNPDTFEFTYEIGISPEVDVKLSGRNKYEYTKVKVDKTLVDKQIEDLTRRYGKLTSGEKVGERDMVLGQLVELNEDGEILEGGVMNDSTISMEFVQDEELKKELIGKKAGDTVVVNPMNISRGGNDTASMLGIEESQLDSISDKFNLTINEVKVMEPAELNQELFDKLFGEGEVTSEEQMREKVEADMAQMFEKDSEKILTRRISNDLIKKTDIQLPEAFLKRWILASQKEAITMEDVENDFENYARSLRWQLIQNSIFKNNDMKVEKEEAVNYTKSLLVNQYAQYGMPAPEDAELTQSAEQVLSNQKEAQQIYDMLAEEKMTKYFKETVKLDVKEVDYDEYVKIAQDSNA
ncbi:trigger factor [Brumimicrobium aurantiacum]|uniref:Trigger factor n=1 Tax=Brumimicrobium aurantiacum TaxID=1737063 RepID=A0A3E1EYK9_9FLAO|nr:trigger factor [Brumimicrobium aurantiacum]RFC54645.1 trigger factor [Brumimicrobium aurantiacum]